MSLGLSMFAGLPSAQTCYHLSFLLCDVKLINSNNNNNNKSMNKMFAADSCIGLGRQILQLNSVDTLL